MSTRLHKSHRPSLAAAALMATVIVIACADASTDTGLGTQQVAFSRDTIPGTGQLAELQQRRAEWLARGIKDYRIQLRISCFCAGDVVRPKLVEVRNGVVSKAWDLETAQPVASIAGIPTITGLFDAAIAERARGGNVSATYDKAFGIPVRLEVGTVANDAGVLYFLGGLKRI